MYLILFAVMVNGIDCLISLSDVSLLKRFLLLIMYPATLPDSLMSSSHLLVASLGLSMCVCHLQTVTVLLLLFQFGLLLFLFLFWLLWPKHPKLCWIVVVKVGTLVWFLTLGEMLSIFRHWGECFMWVYHIWLLSCWGIFLLFLLSGDFLS